MELHDFIEKFSGKNFLNALKMFRNGYESTGRALSADDYKECLLDGGFELALANYTDLICEKQREECALSINSVECFGWIETETTKVIECIRNAPQPKIDELS